MNLRFSLLILSGLLFMNPQANFAADPKPEAIKMAWGDQSNGRFVNPILPADYSDIDAVQVGEDYYAITSTFQYSPGVTIIHSKDLVNWQIVSHAVEDVTQIGPELNWDRMNRYGTGIWAGAIRYHDGRFWIYFGTPDEGFFVTSSKDIKGPWDPLTCIKKQGGWDDCCPFWDKDGQGYFVCTHFKDGYKIYLYKMTPDNKGLIEESGKVIYQSKGSEASKLYLFGDTYYHYFSEVTKEGRIPMMRRAKSLEGPWETKQIGHVDGRNDREPNQGALLELPNGKWWFLTHHGSGGWEGRVMSLLPVEWIDGWPILGKPGADGIGNMVWESEKPIADSLKAPMQMSDAFDSDKIALQWQWNYQPRMEKWSLTERPGYLRLHAFKPLKPGDLLTAGNTLSQRIFRTKSGTATAKIDLAGMSDGQVAGLCHLSKDYAMLAITQENGERFISVKTKSKNDKGELLKESAVWLRTTWNFDGESQFSLSTDGKTFHNIGEKYRLGWAFYRGDRLGLFTFNDQSESGYVDIDSFEMKCD